MLTARLQLVSTSQLRDMILLVLGEDLLLKVNQVSLQSRSHLGEDYFSIFCQGLFYTTGTVRLIIGLLLIENGNNLKGKTNKQCKQHMTPTNKGKQINKQVRKWHVWGHRCRRLYAITQSAESDTQCIREQWGSLGVVRGALH